MKKTTCMIWVLLLGLFLGAERAGADAVERGELQAKDAARLTLTVADQVYRVTSVTQFFNQAGEPIKFEEIEIVRPLFAEFVAEGNVLRSLQLRNSQE